MEAKFKSALRFDLLAREDLAKSTAHVSFVENINVDLGAWLNWKNLEVLTKEEYCHLTIFLKWLHDYGNDGRGGEYKDYLQINIISPDGEIFYMKIENAYATTTKIMTFMYSPGIFAPGWFRWSLQNLWGLSLSLGDGVYPKEMGTLLPSIQLLNLGVYLILNRFKTDPDAMCSSALSHPLWFSLRVLAELFISVIPINAVCNLGRPYGSIIINTTLLACNVVLGQRAFRVWKTICTTYL
jgi:hypothetical protein